MATTEPCDNPATSETRNSHLRVTHIFLYTGGLYAASLVVLRLVTAFTWMHFLPPTRFSGSFKTIWICSKAIPYLPVFIWSLKGYYIRGVGGKERGVKLDD